MSCESIDALKHDPFSAALLGQLPRADLRHWVQTLQQLVASGLSSGRCGHVVDGAGKTVKVAKILEVRAQLVEHGARTGDVVMIKVRNDAGGVTAMLAAWLNGCAVCPVDSTAPREVQELIAEQARAVLIVDLDHSMKRMKMSEVRIRAQYATGADLALMIFTSGSSGRPKGVLLTHSNVISSLRAICTYLDIRMDDRILCVPPLFLDYGLYQVLYALFTGCHLVMATGLTNPIKILGLIKERRPTILPVIPALASGLSTVLNTFSETIGCLRLVSNTGGHLARATVEALRRSFPNARIYPMYGLTETKRALYLPPELVDHKPGSVGGPMPGLDARVVITDDDGQLAEAESGRVGELYLRGASVMQGYHTSEHTAGARLVVGRYRDDVWLATGDLFERDADGYLYFRGRLKSLIKQKGYCIYPRDLESVAEALPEVASAVVVGRGESDGDESAVLFAVLQGEPDEEQQALVRSRILEGLHKSLQPRVIHFLTEWPASPVGKIDLNALVRLAAELP